MKIQRLMFKENLRAAGLVTLLGLASCAIDNDIPYPLVEGTISEIVTEGLRASEDGTVASGVDIDRSARTVTLRGCVTAETDAPHPRSARRDDRAGLRTMRR